MLHRALLPILHAQSMPLLQLRQRLLVLPMRLWASVLHGLLLSGRGMWFYVHVRFEHHLRLSAAATCCYALGPSRCVARCSDHRVA